MTPQFCCWLTSATAGNVAGLCGTLLLAIAAVRVLPLGKQLYRFSRELVKLAEDRREKRRIAARTDRDQDDVEVLRARLDEQDEAYEGMLRDSTELLAMKRDKVTRLDVVVTCAGLLLVLASDGLPLLAPLCKP